MLNDVLNTDYDSFIARELEERQLFKYPPFVRIIEVIIMHKKSEKCFKGANQMAALLKSRLLGRVIGPAVPGIARVRGFYQYQIMIKLEKIGLNIKEVKGFIQECKDKVKKKEGLKTLRINIDVDGY
jgi:primosomal protein N' (replication factor Y)